MRWKLLILLYGAVTLSCSDDDPAGPGKAQPPDDEAPQVREFFSDPKDCQGCHPQHYEEWAMSMHAYSVIDPVFQTLNRIGQERSGNRLDQFCVRCHSPAGSRLGEMAPGFEFNDLSPLAAAGVSCDVCHKIKSVRPGHAIDAFRYDNVQLGTIRDPVPNGFHESEYDPRYAKSEICSGCHNIVTQQGVTVEKTFSEWERSLYPGRGIECQTCHMKPYTGKAAVGAPEREQVHSHIMEGVDIPLTEFPGRDRMIELVGYQLNYSLNMIVEAPRQVHADSALPIVVNLANNITGHSIPSGSVFERQMWIEVLALDPVTGDTLYGSGLTDPNGDLLDHHSQYVKDGILEPDIDLALFKGVPYKNGKEIPFFWEAHSVRFRTIPPFEERLSYYFVPKEHLRDRDAITITVRLFFRAFAPHFLRKIGHPELVEKVVTFEMETDTKEVEILH